VKVGPGADVSVAVGLPVADDGGADAVGEAVTDALADAVGLAAELGVADSVADVVGAAELVVGAGAGGPKQPVRASRAPTPRTPNTESLGLVMMPP
jgi:hypothetical protein